jgi:hypothetical protein
MRKESMIQKAERIARKKSHTCEEQSFLLDMLMHIENNDEDSERMQKLESRINTLLEEWNSEYPF